MDTTERTPTYYVMIDTHYAGSFPSLFRAALFAKRATIEHAYQARISAVGQPTHAYYCGQYDGTRAPGEAW